MKRVLFSSKTISDSMWQAIFELARDKEVDYLIKKAERENRSDHVAKIVNIKKE